MAVIQSTTRNCYLFMADSTDPLAGKTGLTLTVTLSKNGGAFASISPTQDELGNGWYYITLSASDTDTLGELAVNATASGAVPAGRIYEVEVSPVTPVPALTGAVYTATATQNQVIEIVKGDSRTITFDLDADWSGWAGNFALKAKLEDTTYLIGPLATSWTDATVGTGSFSVTAAQTAITPGFYYGELELANGIQIYTAIQFRVRIVEGVIAAGQRV